ncbi:lysophosphatidic acid receptor 6-like [Trichomycterus rosablanca]|uniref:lysophosphatidic acid receptor 6-like n=1 Tax=Trichomycterus rosablanca TaxID=2290929 RepID=UPI002F35D345
MDVTNRTTGLTLFNCSVDFSYRFTYYQITYSIIFICGLASNSRALWHLWHMPPTLTSTAIYMVNLAIVDLFFMVSLPLRIYYYYNRSHSSTWSPGSVFCQLTFTLKYMSMYGGIFFLACIGLDRYFAVTHATPRQPLRARNARSVSTMIWLLVLALSLSLPFLQYITFHNGERTDVPCQLDPSLGHHQTFILVALGLVQVAFLLPTILLLFSYCSILNVLSRMPHRAKFRQQRTLSLIYCVLSVFLLCFAPYHVNLLFYTLSHTGLVLSCTLATIVSALHPVVLSLASVNCCLNPLVYYCSSGGANRETSSSRSSQ